MKGVVWCVRFARRGWCVFPQLVNIFTFATTLLIESVGDLATIEPVQEFSGVASMEEG